MTHSSQSSSHYALLGSSNRHVLDQSSSLSHSRLREVWRSSRLRRVLSRISPFSKEDKAAFSSPYKSQISAPRALYARFHSFSPPPTYRESREEQFVGFTDRSRREEHLAGFMETSGLATSKPKCLDDHGAKWRKAPSDLKQEQDECLREADCISIFDPLANLTRESLLEDLLHAQVNTPPGIHPTTLPCSWHESKPRRRLSGRLYDRRRSSVHGPIIDRPRPCKRRRSIISLSSDTSSIDTISDASPYSTPPSSVNSEASTPKAEHNFLDLCDYFDRPATSTSKGDTTSRDTSCSSIRPETLARPACIPRMTPSTLLTSFENSRIQSGSTTFSQVSSFNESPLHIPHEIERYAVAPPTEQVSTILRDAFIDIYGTCPKSSPTWRPNTEDRFSSVGSVTTISSRKRMLRETERELGWAETSF
ncbi:hypothetical protein BCR39DRAFT_600780 [Naematelia encephala]|uniref:Uncharacterized protein n=1 Tax=Naematelia encephala TaxID=71784 RepID=A0A1Y2ALS2_9TREE|nr:hypothetical protein BCR39DRAFT_600780 [Naematelia encephala]